MPKVKHSWVQYLETIPNIEKVLDWIRKDPENYVTINTEKIEFKSKVLDGVKDV